MAKDPAYDAIAKARRQEESGNPQGAADTLEKYLQEDPHNVAPRIELARVYCYSLNDKNQGLFQLDIVLDLEPENVDALKAMTTIKMQNKRFNRETDEIFQRLLPLVAKRKDPKEYAAVAAQYAVFLRKQMTDFKKSAEYYEKATRADPDRYEYHQDYAVLLLNDLRDYVKAKHELEEVLRLKPNNLSVRNNYERLMREKFDADGNPKKSLKERLFGRH
ncbi:hypothetical protein TALC_01061 [Thermoplasmatales archaeon BRNA1]|nr:hypothetical protein TALC_01061 [Thermoplasmatales archaeon BRNA1]